MIKGKCLRSFQQPHVDSNEMTWNKIQLSSVMEEFRSGSHLAQGLNSIYDQIPHAKGLSFGVVGKSYY